MRCGGGLPSQGPGQDVLEEGLDAARALGHLLGAGSIDYHRIVIPICRNTHYKGCIRYISMIVVSPHLLKSFFSVSERRE